MQRNRYVYAGVIAAVVAAGLLSRSSLACYLPAFIATYAGDTLWALMVFLGLGFVFPRASTLKLAVITLAFSFGIELAQLYQAPWISSLRATGLGALVLGAGFIWSDFVCYTIGCLLGVLGEILASRLHPRTFAPRSSPRYRNGPEL